MRVKQERIRPEIMTNRRNRSFITAALGFSLLAALAGCHHVAFKHSPPGTSVRVATAKRAEPVATPTPKRVTVVERPAGSDTNTENIADYYTLGNLMMQQQKYADAIKAFESALKLDPTFADAWNHLAICYQNSGQPKKAAEAFKKYKAASLAQPTATPSRGQ